MTLATYDAAVEQYYVEAAQGLQHEIYRAAMPPYLARGASLALQTDYTPELVISGAARTGKTRSILEKGVRIAREYDGARVLLMRKTRISLSETALVTLERDVIGLDDPQIIDGATRQNRKVYRFGASVIVVGGFDKPGRILSSEYDLILVIQAEELALGEWETLISRLSGIAVPADMQQIVADVNPDAPTHWIKSRADAAGLRMLNSRHEDNPLLYDENPDGTFTLTPYGRLYIERLDRLTGVRRKRLRFGQWAAAEGAVYGEEYDAAIHLIDSFPIPKDGRRLRVIDFGYTNPFVCQWWWA